MGAAPSRAQRGPFHVEAYDDGAHDAEATTPNPDEYDIRTSTDLNATPWDPRDDHAAHPDHTYATATTTTATDPFSTPAPAPLHNPNNNGDDDDDDLIEPVLHNPSAPTHRISGPLHPAPPVSPRRSSSATLTSPPALPPPPFRLAADNFGSDATHARDLLLLPHHAIRRELADLYKIFNSLEKRFHTPARSNAIAADAPHFATWWADFASFVRMYFNYEAALLLPWLRAARLDTPSAALLDAVREDGAGVRSAWDDAVRAVHRYVLDPAVVNYDAVRGRVDAFAPRVEAFFVRQEDALAPVVAAHFSRAQTRKMERALVGVCKETSKLHPVMLSSWMDEPAMYRDWVRAHYNAVERFYFTSWHRLFMATHHRLLLDFHVKSGDATHLEKEFYLIQNSNAKPVVGLDDRSPAMSDNLGAAPHQPRRLSLSGRRPPDMEGEQGTAAAAVAGPFGFLRGRKSLDASRRASGDLDAEVKPVQSHASSTVREEDVGYSSKEEIKGKWGPGSAFWMDTGDKAVPDEPKHAETQAGLVAAPRTPDLEASREVDGYDASQLHGPNYDGDADANADDEAELPADGDDDIDDQQDETAVFSRSVDDEAEVGAPESEGAPVPLEGETQPLEEGHADEDDTQREEEVFHEASSEEPLAEVDSGASPNRVIPGVLVGQQVERIETRLHEIDEERENHERAEMQSPSRATAVVVPSAAGIEEPAAPAADGPPDVSAQDLSTTISPDEPTELGGSSELAPEEAAALAATAEPVAEEVEVPAHHEAHAAEFGNVDELAPVDDDRLLGVMPVEATPDDDDDKYGRLDEFVGHDDPLDHEAQDEDVHSPLVGVAAANAMHAAAMNMVETDSGDDLRDANNPPPVPQHITALEVGDSGTGVVLREPSEPDEGPSASEYVTADSTAVEEPRSGSGRISGRLLGLFGRRSTDGRDAPADEEEPPKPVSRASRRFFARRNRALADPPQDGEVTVDEDHADVEAEHRDPEPDRDADKKMLFWTRRRRAREPAPEPNGTPVEAEVTYTGDGRDVQYSSKDDIKARWGAGSSFFLDDVAPERMIRSAEEQLQEEQPEPLDVRPDLADEHEPVRTEEPPVDPQIPRDDDDKFTREKAFFGSPSEERERLPREPTQDTSDYGEEGEVVEYEDQPPPRRSFGFVRRRRGEPREQTAARGADAPRGGVMGVFRRRRKSGEYSSGEQSSSFPVEFPLDEDEHLSAGDDGPLPSSEPQDSRGDSGGPFAENGMVLESTTPPRRGFLGRRSIERTRARDRSFDDEEPRQPRPSRISALFRRKSLDERHLAPVARNPVDYEDDTGLIVIPPPSDGGREEGEGRPRRFNIGARLRRRSLDASEGSRPGGGRSTDREDEDTEEYYPAQSAADREGPFANMFRRRSRDRRHEDMDRVDGGGASVTPPQVGGEAEPYETRRSGFVRLRRSRAALLKRDPGNPEYEGNGGGVEEDFPETNELRSARTLEAMRAHGGVVA